MKGHFSRVFKWTDVWPTASSCLQQRLCSLCLSTNWNNRNFPSHKNRLRCPLLQSAGHTLLPLYSHCLLLSPSAVESLSSSFIFLSTDTILVSLSDVPLSTGCVCVRSNKFSHLPWFSFAVFVETVNTYWPFSHNSEIHFSSGPKKNRVNEELEDIC